MPFRVNHVNKATGVTYVYESVSFWDNAMCEFSPLSPGGYVIKGS
jgi:hypothetical protein